jgi:hypothetical protein
MLAIRRALALTRAVFTVAVAEKPVRAILFRLDAAFNSIQHSQLCLLHRRDGIVDRETRFPFKMFGVLLGVFHISIVFGASNAGLQRRYVGIDFRFHGIPVSGRRVASGRNIPIHLFDGRGRGGTCL